MKPLIIISPSINKFEDEIKLSRAYCNAIRIAGGIPLATDYAGIEDLIKIADGILFAGGGDIDPKLTGDIADLENQGQISKVRDEFEYTLLENAVRKNIPVLGICRGMQVIGSFFGAHIIQHMDGHRQQENRNMTVHDIQIFKDTLLYKIIGKEKISVNSFHHQALGEGFEGRISAVSGDVIESIELNENKFVLGVQWHPEHLCTIPEQLKIFKEFVNASLK